MFQMAGRNDAVSMQKKAEILVEVVFRFVKTVLSGMTNAKE